MLFRSLPVQGSHCRAPRPGVARGRSTTHRVSRADMRGPGPKLHPAAPHTPALGRQPLAPRAPGSALAATSARQSLWRPHPWHHGLQTALSPHFRPGRGSCPADSISVGLRLVIGKARFSQRKDRNRSSGRAESEPENSQDLCPLVRTPSPGLRSATTGRRLQPAGGPCACSGRPGGRLPRGLLSGAQPSEGVWVCQLLGFRNFPPEGSQSFKGTANEETGASWGRGKAVVPLLMVCGL